MSLRRAPDTTRRQRATTRSSGGAYLRRGVAAICACLFIALAVPLMLLLNVGRDLLAPSLYKDALVSQDVYGRLPELAAEQIAYSTYASSSSGVSGKAASDLAFIASAIASASTSLSSCLEDGLGVAAYADLKAATRAATPMETEQIKTCLRASGAPSTISQTIDGMPIFFWMLTESDWRGVLVALLPPDWVQAQAERAIDQFYSEVQSGQGNAVVDLSLVALKTRLEGPEGFDAVARLINAQPSCSLDQLGQVAAIVTSNASLGQVPVCRPPDAVLAIMRSSIQAALSLLASQIPDTAEVDLSGSLGGAQANPLGPAHDALDATRVAAWAGIALGILLLLAAVALGARSIAGALRWLGVPLAIAGAVALSFATGSQAVAHGFLTDRLPSTFGGSGIAPGFVALEVDTFNWLAAAFFGRMAMQAVALLVVGLALIGVSLVVHVSGVWRNGERSV